MKVTITYDVSQRQSEIKQQMLSRGFHDRWTYENRVYYLPETTLWHPDLLSTQTAITIFNEVIALLNLNQTADRVIRISHVMAFQFSTWAGIEGEPRP